MEFPRVLPDRLDVDGGRRVESSSAELPWLNVHRFDRPPDTGRRERDSGELGFDYPDVGGSCSCRPEVDRPRSDSRSMRA